MKPAGIYERNDVPVRRLEGMEQRTGLCTGRCPNRVEMLGNGVRYLVDVKNGPETASSSTRRRTAPRSGRFAPGRGSGLLLCHNGSFALNAASTALWTALGVDILGGGRLCRAGERAVEPVENARFQAANCFDLLRELSDRKEQFDLVILDPPAFTKTRSALESALRGYKEINLRGMKLTRPGGFLVTCSCSQHVSPQAFQDMLGEAARDSRTKLRLVEARDRPTTPGAARLPRNPLPEVPHPAGDGLEKIRENEGLDVSEHP